MNLKNSGDSTGFEPMTYAMPVQCSNQKYCPKNEQLAKKRSFEGNCEILRTIFQPRVLSSHLPAAERGLFTVSFIVPYMWGQHDLLASPGHNFFGNLTPSS